MLTCFNPEETCETKGYRYHYLDNDQCFDNRDNCLTLGNNCMDIQLTCDRQFRAECVDSCPSTACITQKIPSLTVCVDITPKMKVFHGICFEGMENITRNIMQFEALNANSGITINAYCAEDSMGDLIKKNPNLTFVDLGECSARLKKHYNLSMDTKLYVLGIDIPSDEDYSSVNYLPV